MNRAPLALLLYVAIACAMTWPVVTGMTRNLPSDLGDPMFVSGMLTWASKHWIDLLSGDLSAVRRFWNAPFFYPETLATGFSEHFILHALLTLPVYIVTHNILLCYNLLFLAAFALSGFGMYLFVRELTGRPLAAFVAGLAFAFAPYRFATIPHLQVISSQWMPFALYGFRRYFMTGRARPLVGGALALWAQHLASGYYMVYFGPFVAIYVLAEIATRRWWTHVKVWLHIAGAALLALALTVPFGLPYLALQRRYNYHRPLHELVYFSADLQAWFTASPLSKIWGNLRTFDKAEGNLFPGVVVVLLAVIGLACAWLTLPALSERMRVEGSERSESNGGRIKVHDGENQGDRGRRDLWNARRRAFGVDGIRATSADPHAAHRHPGAVSARVSLRARLRHRASARALCDDYRARAGDRCRRGACRPRAATKVAGAGVRRARARGGRGVSTAHQSEMDHVPGRARSAGSPVCRA